MLLLGIWLSAVAAQMVDPVQQHALNCLSIAQAGSPDLWCNQTDPTLGWFSSGACFQYNGGGFVNSFDCSFGYYGHLATVFGIYLEDASTSGTLPTILGSFVNLSYFFLDASGISGVYPTAFKQLTTLSDLTLRSERVSGTFPLSNLLRFNQLRTLDIYGPCSGTLPQDLFRPPALAYVYLNMYFLSGTIPSDIGSGLFLTTLYLWMPSVSGSIPAALAQLPQFQSFNSTAALSVRVGGPMLLVENEGICTISRAAYCDLQGTQFYCPIPFNCSSCFLPFECIAVTDSPTASPVVVAAASSSALSTPGPALIHTRMGAKSVERTENGRVALLAPFSGIVGVALGAVAAVAILIIIVACWVSRRTNAAALGATNSRDRSSRRKKHAAEPEEPASVSSGGVDSRGMEPADSIPWQQNSLASSRDQSVQPPNALLRSGLNYRPEGAPGTEQWREEGGASTRFAQYPSVQMSRGEGQARR